MQKENSIIEIYNEFNEFGKWLNLEYLIKSPGEINYSMKVEPYMLATKTAAHGGILAAFMDAIVGVASLSSVYQEGKVVSTIEFKINFLKAAFLNDTLLGKGKVIQKGNRIIVTQGEIFNQNGDLLCTCIATLNTYPFEKSDMFSAQVE
jgi:acyl-CoA thioesterase